MAAPVPRKKEGRAARLAALLEQDGNASNASLASEATPSGDVDALVDEVETKENVDPMGEKKTKSAHREADDDLMLS